MGECVVSLDNCSRGRAEGPKAPSPGHRPGLLRMQTCRPVRAKALKNSQIIHKAFALTIIFALGKIKR